MIRIAGLYRAPFLALRCEGARNGGMFLASTLGKNGGAWGLSMYRYNSTLCLGGASAWHELRNLRYPNLEKKKHLKWDTVPGNGVNLLVPMQFNDVLVYRTPVGRN